MLRRVVLGLVVAIAMPSAATAEPPRAAAATVTLSAERLRDKIRGGWAGQTIGVTFGGPTEFRYRGTMIEDYTPIAWHASLLKETFERSPGLYESTSISPSSR
jgi:hypothetical protein